MDVENVEIEEAGGKSREKRLSWLTGLHRHSHCAGRRFVSMNDGIP